VTTGTFSATNWLVTRRRTPRGSNGARRRARPTSTSGDASATCPRGRRSIIPASHPGRRRRGGPNANARRPGRAGRPELSPRDAEACGGIKRALAALHIADPRES
jgi:hypothetical protein